MINFELTMSLSYVILSYIFIIWLLWKWNKEEVKIMKKKKPKKELEGYYFDGKVMKTLYKKVGNFKVR